MEDLLFLAHRIPYPPDKGDKIRSWHLLRHLAARYRVHLGCFVDDAQDHQHEPVLRALCESCHFAPLDPRLAKLGSLRGLLTGDALTFAWFRDSRADALGQGNPRRPADRGADGFLSSHGAVRRKRRGVPGTANRRFHRSGQRQVAAIRRYGASPCAGSTGGKPAVGTSGNGHPPRGPPRHACSSVEAEADLFRRRPWCGGGACPCARQRGGSGLLSTAARLLRTPTRPAGRCWCSPA